ncbi:MAG: membrane dipeptidase [Haliscomenobacter sp.]|uniref:membrane dipeptidase n=1 Tax=Haliscomenobacter sp. TaxID=2717303 RepID=UPI0029B5014A|nr:membrane dipeptidase [Haliscomenobacter sp.]MDX2072605.1 membrane dipeptidase [Haliscomenobacter sp.]
MRKRSLPLIFIYFVLLPAVHAQEIREFMDLQSHMTVHIPYPFFGKGLTYFSDEKPPQVNYKHTFRNVNHANFLEHNQGARIIINGALSKEWVTSKKKARRMIVEQIEYVNEFIKSHSDQFALAKTPQEVRDLVANTNKTIVIHSIEGGRRLINSQEDADFWASQGVAYITLVHLLDDENGASAITPGLMTRLMNLKGGLRKEKNRRLSEHGKNAIQYLANAGVMIDLTHMSELTRQDALDYMIQHHIPPITTHDAFKPIQNNSRGISPADIIRIYQHNGFVALPLSGRAIKPYKSLAPYQNLLDSLSQVDCYCEGSVDDYKITYQAVKQFIENNVARIAQDSSLVFEALDDSQKVKYSIGFQTDFNGWLSHNRPRYGKEGCYEMAEDRTYEDIETKGLAHPGLLNEHWNLLLREGVDLEPIKRSSEKFLQLWQYFLDHRKGRE